MKTTIEKSEGKALVIFEGELDSFVSDEVGEQLESLYELENTEITLDCSGLDYIASSGLRLFLLLLQNVRSHGCTLTIKGANETLMNVFNSTGFVKCFQFI